MSRNRAFTLIELLVVLAIIGLLAGMLMPVIGLVRRTSYRTNTENLLRKVETAIVSFRKDTRSFPWAGPSPTAPSAGPWGNDLGFRLARDLTSDEKSRLETDLAAVRTAYATGAARITGGMVNQPATSLGYSQTFGAAMNAVGTAWGGPIATAANRVGIERGEVAVLSGNVGIAYTVPNGTGMWQDGPAILASPQSRGYGADYLRGEVQPKELTSVGGLAESIKDSRGGALVYVNPVIVGVGGFLMQGANASLNTRWFNLHSRGRTITASLASDIRTTAASAFVLAPELWSPGEDGLFDAQRDATVNRDNLSITRYLKGLQ